MDTLFNTQPTNATITPERGFVRTLTFNGKPTFDYPQGCEPVCGPIRVVHYESDGYALIVDRAENPRLTGQVAKLFDTGLLRFATADDLSRFLTDELRAQWSA